jgi:hypothetical protein
MAVLCVSRRCNVLLAGEYDMSFAGMPFSKCILCIVAGGLCWNLNVDRDIVLSTCMQTTSAFETIFYLSAHSVANFVKSSCERIISRCFCWIVTVKFTCV